MSMMHFAGEKSRGLLARTGRKWANCRICRCERQGRVGAGRGALGLAIAVSVIALSAFAPAAQAQTAPAAGGARAPVGDTTTTTSAPAAPTTTTTTTTATKTTTTTKAVATTTTTVPVATTTVFPPDLLAIANSVRRSPPNNDASLMAALVPLQALGYTAQQADIAGMGQFPVAGPAFFADDWLEPRPGDPPRLHLGDDVVAAMGTPIRAPIDGVLTYETSDPTGYGLASVVTGPDHTFYRMAHMSATVVGLASGSSVKQGQVIGFVGATGDATGPHVHFEVHPLGGAGVDPKAILDGWLVAAKAAAPALIAAVKAAHEPATTTAIPLPVVLPLPLPEGFSPPLAVSVPLHKPADSQAGLALFGLICLLACCALAAHHFRLEPDDSGPQISLW
jgi:murein DD-endopeptidase MepM/ murein hydrolase activator NlpD